MAFIMNPCLKDSQPLSADPASTPTSTLPDIAAATMAAQVLIASEGQLPPASDCQNQSEAEETVVMRLIKERSFIPDDFSMFAKFKWSPELVERSRIARVTDDQAEQIQGLQWKGNKAGILFRYFDWLYDNKALTLRLRRDHPEIENGKEKNKYIQPSGEHHLYFLPGSADLLWDAKVPVVLVEAEKSVLSLAAWSERTGQRILPVGMGGCWGWRDLPELPVCCWGKQVFVMLDSNAASNPKVGSARDALVQELHRCLADVQIANVPAIDNVNGPDDLLARPDGDETLQSILDNATFCKPSTVSASDKWPDPEPLGTELPPVPPFDLQLLPTSLRALVQDVATRMQVPLDYPAVVAVLCLAGVTNRRATIQPKAKDNSWIVVPNLWGGIVAPPGKKKSPLISALTEPLNRIEAEWQNDYEGAISVYEQELEKAKLQNEAWATQFKKACKNGMPPPDKPTNNPAEPIPRRLITHDATLESLHVILNQNPAGVLVIRDELTGWLSELEHPNRQGERAFFLSAWNGDTGHTIDRVGRGHINVKHCCVSMLAGIQPARLRGYMAEALRNGPGNDGLMQRFQVMVYPDPLPDWEYVDTPPNLAALQEAEQTYRCLLMLDPSKPLNLRFDPEAQQFFEKWQKKLETDLTHNRELHPAMVSHLSKYPKLMPSLALLFELADGGKESVSLLHARQASAFCEYLRGHADRIYSTATSPKLNAAMELAYHLSVGWKHVEGKFTEREVYRNGWRGLSTPEEAGAALSILEDAGWVRLAKWERKVAGRSTRQYLINLKIPQKPK